MPSHRKVRGSMTRWTSWFFGLVAAAAPLTAQTPEEVPAAGSSVEQIRQELADLKSEYERRIADLERRLEALSAGSAAPPVETPQIAEVPPAAAPAQTSNYFNPAISLIGNFLAVGGKNRVEDLPSSSFRESELGIQSIIDPYAKADVFLAFGEEGVEVEEGYATFTALPADLLLRVGKMRVGFGKVNTLHLHTLPWPDQPLTTVNLLGGDEGWLGTGVSIARLLPIGDTFTEATVQVFRGEAEGLFEANKRSDLAYNGHYRVFRDLTEASNLDLGVSYGRGPNGTADGNDTELSGLDFTYRWKPLQTASYRSATVRGEVVRSRREQIGGREDALGWFLSGDYQLAKRWGVGARFESAEHADDGSLRDTGQALLLTFSPSEFLALRSELRRRRFDLGDRAEIANELLLQLQFAIGAHGAHPF